MNKQCLCFISLTNISHCCYSSYRFHIEQQLQKNVSALQSLLPNSSMIFFPSSSAITHCPKCINGPFSLWLGTTVLSQHSLPKSSPPLMLHLSLLNHSIFLPNEQSSKRFPFGFPIPSYFDYA